MKIVLDLMLLPVYAFGYVTQDDKLTPRGLYHGLLTLLNRQQSRPLFESNNRIY